MSIKKLEQLAKMSERNRRITAGRWNEEKITQLSVRISQSTRDGLEDIAKKVRMQTGEECRLADIIRVALNEYIEREELSSK